MFICSGAADRLWDTLCLLWNG